MKTLLILLIGMLALLSTAMVSAQKSGSCIDSNGETFCGSVSKDGCYCDTACVKYGDCCNDVVTACPAKAVCGNGICETAEKQICGDDPNCLPGQNCADICLPNLLNCPQDCSKSVCGDGVCAIEESCGSNCLPGQVCPQVCVVTCPQDCSKSVCGDGVCTPDENQDIVCPSCVLGGPGILPPTCECLKKCPADCAITSETVTCTFIDGSGVPPGLYDSKVATTTPLTGKVAASPADIILPNYCMSSTGAECSGQKSCSVKVSGAKGTSVKWKSSCGGYQYSTIDGKDEKIYFYCPAQSQITKYDVLNWIQKHCDEPYGVDSTGTK